MRELTWAEAHELSRKHGLTPEKLGAVVKDLTERLGQEGVSGSLQWLLVNTDAYARSMIASAPAAPAQPCGDAEQADEAEQTTSTGSLAFDYANAAVAKKLGTSLAKKVAQAEPVAWMRDTGEDSISTMSFVCTNAVKELWLKANPKQVERYTVPLYAAPQPSPTAVVQGEDLVDPIYVLSLNEEAMEEAIQQFDGSSTGEALKCVFHAQKLLRALLAHLTTNSEK